MTYLIDRLDDFGRGITYVDGKICFVSNALVNEEVNIEIEKEKSKYIEAKQVNLLKKSDKRKDTPCPFYSICGGCNIMHMNYEAQLEFKKKKVEDILSRYASLDNVVQEILPTKEYIYRNKITLKVINGKLGYYKEKTNELVPIDKCLLCSGAINETIKELNNLTLSNIYEVIIRSNYKGEVLLCLKGKDIDSKYFIDKLYKVQNIIVFDNNKEETIKGNNYIIDEIDDMKFKISIDSFFQVNSYGVNVLYNEVLNNVKDNCETILDLYCGTGTIGLFLSKRAKQVYGVEINESAVKDANFNKKLNSVNNIDFICTDVANIKNDYKNVDLIVIDPPRSGLSNKAISNIKNIESKRIIYVSCDPVTLARDLKELSNDYRVEKITLVDMFPNTYHCESITVLEKKL